MNKKEFKELLTNYYKSADNEQHNKNLEIIIDCYLDEMPPMNKKFYTQGFDLQAFAIYASNNYQKFIDKGAVPL